MSKKADRKIQFECDCDDLVYRGAKGKTFKELRVASYDGTFFVAIAFSDRTELSLNLDLLPVAQLDLLEDVKGDLELLSESRPTRLPETSIRDRWPLQKPPKANPSKRSRRTAR